MIRMMHLLAVFAPSIIVQLMSLSVVHGADDAPFAGRYSGSYRTHSTDPNFLNNQRGAIEMVIRDDGRVTGVCTNYSFNPPIRLVIEGGMDRDGYILEVVATTTTEKFLITGKFALTESGSLKGNLEQFSGQKLVGTLDAELVPE